MKDIRSILLGLIAVDLPLEVDRSFGYDHARGALGAFGGINVSVTTLALVGLLALRLWRHYGSSGQSVGSRQLRYALPFAVYVGAVTISTLQAQDRFLAVSWVLLLLQDLALFAYLLTELRERRDIDLFVRMLLAGVAIEELVLIYQWTTGASSLLILKLANNAPGGAGRLTGSFGSPNTAASYLSLLLPIAFALSVTTGRRGTRFLTATITIVGLAVLLGTQSRGGLIALGVSLVSLTWVFAKRDWLSKRVGIAVGLSLAVTSVAFGSIVLHRFQADQGSLQGRQYLMQIASSIIRSHAIFGVGANNYTVDLPAYLTPEFDRQFIYVVHDDFLLVWAEAGLIGLICYLWFWCSLLFRTIRSFRWCNERACGAILLACITGLIGQLIQAAVEPYNGRAQTQGIVMIAALALVVSQSCRSASGASARAHTSAAVCNRTVGGELQPGELT